MRRWLRKSTSSARRCDTRVSSAISLRSEAAGAVGDIGHHVIGAERALDRQGKIVGRALGLEIMQDREIERIIGDIDPAPHRLAGHQHPANRVIFVAVHILHFVGDEPEHGPAGGAPPDEVKKGKATWRIASEVACSLQRVAPTCW